MTNQTTADRWPAVRRQLTGLRHELRERRQSRATHHQLVRDLADYRTPTDVDDLLAALDRMDTPQTDEIRAILAENVAAYHRGRRLTA